MRLTLIKLKIIAYKIIDGLLKWTFFKQYKTRACKFLERKLVFTKTLYGLLRITNLLFFLGRLSTSVKKNFYFLSTFLMLGSR